jgi:hypothetical protein
MNTKEVHIDERLRNRRVVPLCLRSKGDKATLNGKEVIER